MSKQYAKALPVDRSGNVMTNFPPVGPALATTTRENASASSVTSLDSNATTIELVAIGAGAGLKWATTQATSVITIAGTANFDHFVPSGTKGQFVVPQNSIGMGGSVVGLNALNGLFPAVATITSANGSVMLTQY